MPELNQPGLGELREAVANARRRLPGGRSLRQDGVAGLSLAIANVPDGMANGLLVGVNPIYGLYATIVGPVVGGIFTATPLMVITTTAAASLTAGQSLVPVPAPERGEALFITVFLVGVFQIVFGALGLGRLTRFVSYSVTTGFLAGVSVLLIASQIPTMTGAAAENGNKIVRAFGVLTHVHGISVAALATGLMALVLAVVLPRTKLRNAGRLLAVVIPSAAVAALGLHPVPLVRDVGTIAGGLPPFAFPSLLRGLDVLTGALSVAIVTLVQGAGVSQSVPKNGARVTSDSRDFIAHGAANLASGLFHGLPVGGSLSATAINVISGAATRWASIFAGLWMALIVAAVPFLVSAVAMPALGALLIVAGVSSLRPADVRALWNAGWPSVIAGGTTFLATLFLPIQAAVGIGVAMSALLFVTQSSTDVTVVELARRANGDLEEREPPRRLPDGAVTVLDVYGDLFYAGARTLERLLPSPHGARAPAVILRLRGRSSFGATLIEVLSQYADDLDAAGGRLYLTGISPAAFEQVLHSGKLHASARVRAHRATPVIWESTRQALEDARAWLATGGSRA